MDKLKEFAGECMADHLGRFIFTIKKSKNYEKIMSLLNVENPTTINVNSLATLLPTLCNEVEKYSEAGNGTLEDVIAVTELIDKILNLESPVILTDETVLLLCKEIASAEDHIKITINSDELEMTKTEAKGTYQDIKDYIFENYGIKMHTQFIAEIKRELGLIERENYNKSKKDDDEYNKSLRHCTEENRKIIIEAFKHFKMI